MKINLCKTCNHKPELIYMKMLREQNESYSDRDKRSYWFIDCCGKRISDKNKEDTIKRWNSSVYSKNEVRKRGK